MDILFYSRECTTCVNLLKVLQNENMINHFKLFCVDDRLNELPVDITVVPTLIVSSVNKPLVAQEAFDWIKKVKFLNQKSPVKSESDVIGWMSQEMGGVSDSYAYTKVDTAQPRSYLNYNSNNGGIYTPPNMGKINKKQQDDMIKKVENFRTNQDNSYVQFMKKQQVDAVLEADREELKHKIAYESSRRIGQNSSSTDMERLEQLQQLQNIHNLM